MNYQNLDECKNEQLYYGLNSHIQPQLITANEEEDNKIKSILSNINKNQIDFLEQLGSNFGLSYLEGYIKNLELVSHSRRLQGCGLVSSMIGMDILLDKEDKIDIDEFYHDRMQKLPTRGLAGPFGKI